MGHVTGVTGPRGGRGIPPARDKTVNASRFSVLYVFFERLYVAVLINVPFWLFPPILCADWDKAGHSTKPG